MIIGVSSIINLIIFFSFLGHFGIKIMGQNVYYYYIIEIFLLSIIFFNRGIRIDSSSFEIKLLLIFFFLIIISSFINAFADIPDFKGQSISISSLKATIYITLNFLMINLIVYYGDNKKFFDGLCKTLKYIIIFYIIYFALESYQDYFQKNDIIKYILNIFHISSRSINKGFINLLGHEHSNSSIFVLILYSFMVANIFNQKKVFGSSLIDIFIVLILTLSIFLLESKLGYLIFAILNFFIFIQKFMNAKNNLKYFLSLFFFLLLLYFFYQFFDYKILKAMGLIINYDHPSFNIRANFALASIYMMLENPFFGVGVNNFKFYLEDTIINLESIEWLNIKTTGNIGGSELELNTYLYNTTGMPDPANLLLGIGAEMGVLALIIFLILLSRLFFKSYSHSKSKQLNENDTILAQFLFYSLIVIIFSFPGFYQWYFIIQWIIIGLNICFFAYVHTKYKT